MVHGNSVFIREEAKLDRKHLPVYIFNAKITPFNFANFPEHTAYIPTGCKNLLAHVIMM